MRARSDQVSSGRLTCRQHRQLVSDREDIGILLDVAQTMDAEELTQAAGEEIEERQGHDRPAWSASKSWSRPLHEQLHPTVWIERGPPASAAPATDRLRESLRCRR